MKYFIKSFILRFIVVFSIIGAPAYFVCVYYLRYSFLEFLFLNGDGSFVFWLIILGCSIPDAIKAAREQIKFEHELYVKSQTPVYCAKCDQYLGKAEDFAEKCDRCGSNRWQY